MWFEDKLNVERLQEELPPHQHLGQQESPQEQPVAGEEGSQALSGDVRASCGCSGGLAG